MCPPRQEQATGKRRPPLLRKVILRWRLGVAVLGLLALGAMLVGWAIRREDLRMREELLAQTRQIAQTIPLDRLKVLHGTRDDEQKPEYRRLKSQLMAAQQIDPDWQWIYLMGRRGNGAVYFQMDSEAFDAPDPSPPGQFYTEASPALREVFDTRIAAIEGPIPDRWGTWVSAFVPVIDPKTDQLVTVVGVDVEASRWRAQAWRAGLVPVLSTGILLVILLAGYRLEQRRKHPGDPARRPWRYLEAMLTLCTGLVLTLTASWIAGRIETQHREEAFAALAQIKSERILDAFMSLRHSELEGLARFIEGSEEVTLPEFRRYARHLARVPEVVAWAWVPAVEAAGLPAFEQSILDGGWQGPEYRIWETDEAGQPIPAADRPVHYPIGYVEAATSLSRYGLMPGRDLAAIGDVRAVLVETEQNGLISATDLLPPLPGATGRRTLILVFRPVRKFENRGMPKGFVMAAVDPQVFLLSFLGETPEEDRQVARDLLLLRPGAAPQSIASIAAPGSPAGPPKRLTDSWTLTRPIIAFGKTYAVAIRPAATFLAIHTYHLGWMVLLAGLSITLAGGVVINFNVHRREDLARMVDDQRRKLAESAHHFSLLAKQNRIVTWETDVNGLYVDVGDTAEEVLGYRPEELIGKKHFYDLYPEEGREAYKASGFALAARGESIQAPACPMVKKSGEIVWVSTAGIPLRDALGRPRGYWGTETDITERKRNEERMARLLEENQVAANRYAALIKASNTGAWEYNHATKRIWCSPEYFGLLGYETSDFELPPERRTIDALWLDLIHPGDREAARRYLAAYLEAPRRFFDHRFRMRRKDGAWAWIWSRGQMLFDAADQPTAIMVGTHIDVTESMRAEESLRENEQKYRMLTENMKDVVWVADVDAGRFLYLSPSIAALRGLTPAEVMAQPMEAAFAPAKRAEIMERVRSTVAEYRAGRIPAGTFFTQEIPQLRKDGTVVDTEAVCHLWVNERTGRLELHGVTRDITERKRAERDLSAAVDRFDRLAQQNRAIAWELDVDGVYTSVSAMSESIIGYRPEEMVGRMHFYDLCPEPDREEFKRWGLDLLRRGEPVTNTVNAMVAKSGETVWVASSGIPIRDAQGRVTGYWGTDIDVTARVRAEEALRESERKYRMLTESMKDVVWIVDAETLRFLYVSPSVEALRGYSAEEVMAGTLADSLVPGQIDHLKQMIDRHAAEFRRGEITARTFFTLELRQPRKNAGPIITEAIARFWLNEQTGHLELHGVTRDITERKRAEEDYRTLFQNMLEGFALHEIVCNEKGETVDYRFLAVNPAFERMTGLKAADLVGKTARSTMPDLEPRWIEAYDNVVRTGLPAFFENFAAPPGRHFEVAAFRSAPGQFACIFTDVTERKLAENELRESRRRYVALLANLPGMAYRCKNDRSWTMEFASQGCLDLTGYAPEALIDNRTLSFNDLVLPAYRDAVWNRWREILPKRGVFEMEYEIATRSGETKWVWEQGEGVYDEQGHVVALEGFISDVTARKRAEAERERLIRAIEQSGETILITDAAGAILYVNPAFTRVTGYSREEVLGQSPRLLQSGQHDPAFYRELWKALADGRTWEGQIVNKRKDGALFTVQAAISPVRDAAGHVVNFVAVQRDITQQLRAEEEKDALQSQLSHAQKLESIGRLAGGVAHDFNNMLQAILGYVEIAIEQVPPDQPLHADLREIQKAATRSTSLTRQLQAFARKQVASPKVLDLNEAVEGTFGMLRRLIGEDVQLVWKPGRNVGRVRIDPSQLDQIVANLCINARDAIGPAGHVTIETTLENVRARADVPSLDLAPGTYAVLSVLDDGSGMKPDVIDHIFEPFFTTKPVGKGTGLGLSTVYGTVKQNGGGIRVQSQVGKGSTFKIYLPRHDPKNEPAPAPPEAGIDDPPAAHHEVILLVEDEDVILRTTKRILESLGYRVLATDSPQDALRIAAERQGQIDLLLTDVIMSGMNGPELVRQLKDTHPSIRHLYMSGYTANLLAEQGVKENNANFIQKPFSRNALARKVKDALVRT